MAINRINLEILLPYINENFILLVPNLRTKDAIISQYLESRQQRVSAAPKIWPIDIFIKRQWELNARTAVEPCCNLQLISAEEELLIWNEVVETSLESLPLLNLEETANAASHSYRTARQWLDNERLKKEISPNSSIKDIAVFSEWIKRYKNHCQEQQLISLADAIPILINVILKNGLAEPSNKVILVNFFNPPPLYQKFFAVLPESTEIFTTSIETNSCARVKTIMEFQSQDSEVHHCALWTERILTMSPNAHIGIVTGNKEYTRSKLELALKNVFASEHLFSNSLQQGLFNTTSNDRNLLDSALIYDAFLILNLGIDQYNTNDIIRLLQSPFFNLNQNVNPEADKDIYISIAANLRQRAKPNISSLEFLYLIEKQDEVFYSKILASQLVNLRTKIRKIKNQGTPLQWSHLFEETLRDFGWPGKSLVSGEDHLKRQWQELLTKFSTSSTNFSGLPLASALAKLRLLAKKTLQTNHFDASLPISYFSINEAVGLEFEYLWMLGMDDQHWPEPVNASPFLPYSLQKELNIPGSHSEVQLNSARTYFQQLLTSTKTAVLASYHKSDGEQEFRPSSFLLDFDLKATDNEATQLLSNKGARQLGSIKLERINDEGLPLTASEKITGGATLISDQSNCPFKAFALNRLNLVTEPVIETGISKTAKGNAIHIALEKLFKNISTSEMLNSRSSDQLNRDLDNAATKAVQFLIKAHKDLMTPKLQRIEYQRTIYLLEKFIELEKARPNFQIIAQEKSFVIDIENLRLSLRIDRIDQLQDAGFALIDYKTGRYSASPKNWNAERPEDMQLPLYYFIANNNEFQPINTVAIANINPENVSYSGIATSNNFAKQIKPLESEISADLSWQQTTKAWLEKVKSFAREFNQGECNVNPVNFPTTCTYCGLQALCRIQELSDIEQMINEDIKS